ncbi:MAG: glutamyl-tRNA reductase [Pirellulales bacterium]
MKVRMIGCSHRTSSIEVRERVAFDAAQAREALDLLRERFSPAEVVLLSTCNRVEIYTAALAPSPAPTAPELIDFLVSFHGVPSEEVRPNLVERADEEAVRHLFTVAASLDSMVVGESQILSQVKQAYQLANERNTTGPVTHALFQGALKVAHRVATETQINQRRLSIPSVAVADFAGQVFERFDDKNVLVIGAGEMAEETLRYLKDAGASRVTVVNRTAERAEKMAEAWQAQAEPWQKLASLVAAADLVISTTGADEPIFCLADYQAIEPERRGRPLFILDLAVPRDFDPAIGKRPEVYLYSIDDLRETCERNRQARDKELPAAVRIVEQETRRFVEDVRHHATVPVIQRLQRGWHDRKEEELRRLFNKLGEMDPKARDEIRQSFDRLLNKLLHLPMESLRDESRQGIPHGLLDALTRLFQLKD